MNLNYYIKRMSIIVLLFSVLYLLYANNKQKKKEIDFSGEFLFFQQVDIFYLSAREIRTNVKSKKFKEKNIEVIFRDFQYQNLL